nr:class I tRNA ligase family protein [Pyrinomonadaceae bacterium]
TAAPKSHARRSAQTALYAIADALARLLAPILVFTADEIWENLPAADDGEGTNSRQPVSVHLAEFPNISGVRDSELQARWLWLFAVRDVVLRSLEEARVAKLIGGSLEACVELRTSDRTYELLDRYRDWLRYIFIVSQVKLTKLEGMVVFETGDVDVTVARAEGEKCERCWTYSTRVGESERYPTACERCVAALAEIEATERGEVIR